MKQKRLVWFALAATVREFFTLAADVEVLSVLPHAHYLGKSLEAIATPPGGRPLRLLLIANWDFNWQGDYLFEKPVFLPQGTTLSMMWHFDNSIDNARNPHQPPQRVRYGLQSTDEMAELWLQVLPRRTNELTELARYDQPRVFRDAIAFNQYVIGLNPNDARAHNEIGKAQLFLGNHAEAGSSLRRAAGPPGSIRRSTSRIISSACLFASRTRKAWLQASITSAGKARPR